jgi:hypothetical protein
LGGITSTTVEFDIFCGPIRFLRVGNVRERLREKIGEFGPDEARTEPAHD